MIWAILAKNWQAVAGIAVITAALLFWQIDRRAQFAAGYEKAQAENRQADFDQAKERMENDAAVDDMSDADLCALLGGLYRNGTCE